MLLNRVRLQGFLAHRGQEVDGAIGPIELDFRESGLWLMYGANGSGKSSVFDAITFALFNKARGNQYGKLVNDRSQSAFVEVEFEHDGERYLVKRHLKMKKNREGHESLNGNVLRWDTAQNGWVEVEGVGKDIKNWTTKTLQVSYENFVSSVILEQGRADKFLCAPAAERRAQLMELLDLSVYKKIGAAANDQRKESETELKAKQAQLGRAVPTAPEDLERAETETSDAQTQFAESGEALGSAQNARDDAARAARLDAQIIEKTEQQAADAEILAGAREVEDAVRERGEIGAIMPSLRALSNARRARDDAGRELGAARVTLENAQRSERDLAPVVEEAREDKEAAGVALIEARLHDSQAELNGKSAQSDADIVRQIVELEAQIADGTRELEPHREWLERTDSIVARRTQIMELREIARLVKPVNESARRLNRARGADREAQTRYERARVEAKNAQAALENASAARRAAEGAGDELRTERAELKAKLEFNRETLAARDELGHAEECPTCGSALDDPEARERIAEERELLRRALAKWAARVDEIDGQLLAREAEKSARVADETSARDEFDRANNAASKAEGQRERTAPGVAEQEREYQSARADAGDWADEDLAELQARLAALEPQTIESDWSALQDARDAQRQIEAAAKANRAQLSRLPNWDAAKRHAVSELQHDLASVLARTRAELGAAQAAANAADESYNAAHRDLTAASTDATIAIALEIQKAAAVVSAQTALSDQLDALPAAWKDHGAAHEDVQLTALSVRYDALQTLAARADELRAARQRVRDLESEIGILRAQIAAIPTAHRLDVAGIENAFLAARGAHEMAGERLEDAREKLLLTRNQRVEWARCEEELAAAQIEFGRDDELAKALGSEGLQARIIKRAQESLRDAANEILERLTNGGWQIDLREQTNKEKKQELEIIARDDARGGHERTFDALSGGERFRVAISLAIAIGQMAAGGAPMNTLVIDEGFGALDAENRDLMVANLRHLSQHELKGGRIIVVSHQDDVRESFDYRYQLSRDAEGYAKVEATFG